MTNLQIPRSFLVDMHWPAMVQGSAAKMLGLQYQFLQTERLSAEELRARQFSQLSVLLAHCDRTMPFYRERIRAAGYQAGQAVDEAIWARIPVLTRAEVAAAGSKLHCLSVPPQHGQVLRARLPGPAGRPMVMLTTELHAFFNDAFMLRDHIWQNTDFRGKWGRIAHDPGAVGGGARGAREKDWGAAISAVYPTGPSVAFDANRPAAEQAAWLAREKPDYLSAAPETILALGSHLRDRGQKPTRLRALRCDGVPPDGLVALCREIFGLEPIVVVIVPEFGGLALQCREHGNLHGMAEGIMLEVLAVGGTPCQPGESGRLVATALHNFAMPLLRYDTGLRAEPGPPCGCGRSLPVLLRVTAGSA